MIYQKLRENLDWRYDKRNKDYFTWINDDDYIVLKRNYKIWFMESNIIKNNKSNMELESKAQGYRIIRKVIKENEKPLL